MDDKARLQTNYISNSAGTPLRNSDRQSRSKCSIYWYIYTLKSSSPPGVHILSEMLFKSDSSSLIENGVDSFPEFCPRSSNDFHLVATYSCRLLELWIFSSSKNEGDKREYFGFGEEHAWPQSHRRWTIPLNSNIPEYILEFWVELLTDSWDRSKYKPLLTSWISLLRRKICYSFTKRTHSLLITSLGRPRYRRILIPWRQNDRRSMFQTCGMFTQILQLDYLASETLIVIPLWVLTCRAITCRRGPDCLCYLSISK